MKTRRQFRITAQSASRIAAAAIAFSLTFVPQSKACGNSINVNAAGANVLRLAPMLAIAPSLPPAFTAPAGNQAGDNGPSIVGMWEVTMHTGNVLYEHAFQQFYADGNEMQNSGLYPPEVGNMCFGTWKQRDARTFKLKHYGWLFDHGNLVGTLILTATITVGMPGTGNTYFGNFVADVVLPSGNVDHTQHAEGSMQAKRLTID